VPNQGLRTGQDLPHPQVTQRVRRRPVQPLPRRRRQTADLSLDLLPRRLRVVGVQDMRAVCLQDRSAG
jgi:hypothetical protein